MTKEIGFGLVGYGLIGKVHAEVIRAIAGARLLAVCGRDLNRTADFAARFGSTGYTDYDDFIKHPGLQVVGICTPNGTHAELGIRAAKAGKHVLVEKPIEIDLDRADRLIDACGNAGVKSGDIFQSRFLPAVLKIKRSIDNGKQPRLILGDVYVKSY